MAPRVRKFYSGKTFQDGYGVNGCARPCSGLIMRGYANQRGHGIGAIFKVLSKVALPLIRKTARIGARTLKTVGKRALRTAGKRALRAGANAMKDIAFDDVKPQDAFKERAKEIFHPPKTTRKKPINTTQRKRNSVSSKKTLMRDRAVRKSKVVAPYLTQ